MNRAGGEAVKVSDVKGGVSDYAWSPDSTSSDPRRRASPIRAIRKTTRKKEPEKTKTPPPIVIDRYHFKEDVARLPARRAHASLPVRRRDEEGRGPHPGQLTTKSMPVWSPDGTRIAFVSKRGTGDLDRSDNTDIFVDRRQGRGAAAPADHVPGIRRQRSRGVEPRRQADRLPDRRGAEVLRLQPEQAGGHSRRPAASRSFSPSRSIGRSATPIWSADGSARSTFLVDRRSVAVPVAPSR